MFIELLATGQHRSDLVDTYDRPAGEYQGYPTGAPIITVIGWTALPSQRATVRQALGLSDDDQKILFSHQDGAAIDFQELDKVGSLAACPGLGLRMRRLLEAGFSIWYRDNA